MNRSALKSTGAVLAGFIAVFVLSAGTDFVMQKFGVFSPLDEPGSYTSWMLLIATGYRCLYTVAGGYLAAKLAPDRPMRHAVILGCLGWGITGTRSR